MLPSFYERDQEEGLRKCRTLWDISMCPDCVEYTDKLRDMIIQNGMDYLAKGKERRERISSMDDIIAHANSLRDDFWESVGGKPEGSFGNVCKTGEIFADTYRIEKLLIEVREGSYISANLYMPINYSGKIPAVLTCPGHNDDGKASTAYQYTCEIMAQNGLAALCFDPFGQGERCEFLTKEGFNPFNGCSDEHNHMDWQLKLAGWSLARFFAHDCECLIDYLRSREEINPDKVAVTGHSGGGTMTYLSMITCFDKIAAAAPCSYNTSTEMMLRVGTDMDNEMMWPGYYRKGYDYADELICMAGKPVMLLLNQYDFFSVEGAYQTLHEAEKYWKLVGKPENLRAELSKTNHEYCKSLIEAMCDFFMKTMMGTEKDVKNDFQLRKPEELFVTLHGQLVNDIPNYKTVRMELDDRINALRTVRKGKTEKEKTEYLRSICLEGRKDSLLYSKLGAAGTIKDMTYETYCWNTYGRRYSNGVLFDRVDGETTETIIALWRDGTESVCNHGSWINKQIKDGKRVFVPDVACVGIQMPAKVINKDYRGGGWGTIYRLLGMLIKQGDSIAALRIADCVKSAEFMRERIPDGTISFYGEDEFAIYAQFAARILNIKGETAGECNTFEEIASEKFYDNTFYEAWAIPGILEYFD